MTLLLLLLLIVMMMMMLVMMVQHVHVILTPTVQCVFEMGVLL
jgi:hypothetical protein